MMKTIKTIIGLMCFFIFITNCNGDKKALDVTANNNLQIIDMDKAKKEDRIYLSELFSNVKTIILETNEDVLLAAFNGLQVYKDLLFILDNTTGVYIFNKDGKFIRNIGKRGNGPDEYLEISDFTIDRDNEEIYLMDCEAHTIHKYKFTGEFESSIRLKDKDVTSFQLQYSNGRLYTYVVYAGNKTGCMLQEIDLMTGEQKNCWLDSDQYNRGLNELFFRGESFFCARKQDSFKFTHFFMDTIISGSKGRIEPAFVLKDNNWVTHKDVQKAKQEADNKYTWMESIRNQNIAFNITNYMEWNDFICFNYDKKNNHFFVLHNVKDNTTRYANWLINNLVFDDAERGFASFACADLDGLYEVVSPNMMVYFMEQVKDKGFLNPNLDKIEQLKNLPEDPNPVIFFYEYAKK